jgi:hypothetical protein
MFSGFYIFEDGEPVPYGIPVIIAVGEGFPFPHFYDGMTR